MTDPLVWPDVLIRNAAICELGAALFKACGQCSGGPTDLTAQPPHVRQHYITRADELLRAFTAPDFATGLRPTHGKVIGQIQAVR